jgi:hypothetical protein
MNNIIKLEKVEKVIAQLEEKQASLSKKDHDISSMLMFFQTIQHKININYNVTINVSRLKKIINSNLAEVEKMLLIDVT